MKRPKVGFFKDTGGMWRFVIVAGNGKTVAGSGGYTRRFWAVEGYKSLKRILKSARIVYLD